METTEDTLTLLIEHILSCKTCFFQNGQHHQLCIFTSEKQEPAFTVVLEKSNTGHTGHNAASTDMSSLLLFPGLTTIS